MIKIETTISPRNQDSQVHLTWVKGESLIAEGLKEAGEQAAKVFQPDGPIVAKGFIFCGETLLGTYEFKAEKLSR